METWVKIQEVSGNYQISNYGNVKSNISNIILKQSIVAKRKNKQGYKVVNLKGNLHYVHRLVANAFIPNPNQLPEVNHIDGNKFNNHVNNLEWVTSSENMKHAYKTGLIKHSRKFGKDNPISKLVLQKDKKTLEVLHRYYGVREASRMTNIATSDICNCCNHKKGHYSAGGYVWEYTES